MENRELDLLVIGGGITGAGIALDATVRGFQTGLIEMQDFSAGTSSRSTKLIHGGLRYLKQLELKLVAEVGKERAIVYENAPHVTTPEWMLLPIIEGGTFGKMSTSFGLKVYDFLARVEKQERRKMLNRNEVLEMEPLIKKSGLKGAGVYVEYRTDDARLTIEVLKEAVRRGARAVNYSKADQLIYENGKIAGVNVLDVISGFTYKIRAKKIVNATGPWVDTLREKDRSKTGKHLHLTKGIHVVIDKSRFPLKQAIYFDTEKDGRMIFAIPRDGKTYVGTTDTHYKGDYTHPRMLKEDRDYVIRAVNYMFPSLDLSGRDVESSWVGLRPLIYEEGKRASEISRKDEIFISKSGLISIAGGKLTGYRKMAERIVDIVSRQLGKKLTCTTAIIKLSGGDVGGSRNFEIFSKEKVGKGFELGLSERESRQLVKLYGSNVDKIFSLVTENKCLALKYDLPISLLAQLKYAIYEEMVCTPIDFFNRRIGALLFNIELVKEHKERVLRFMKNELNWTFTEAKKYSEELIQELKYAQYPDEELKR